MGTKAFLMIVAGIIVAIGATGGYALFAGNSEVSKIANADLAMPRVAVSDARNSNGDGPTEDALMTGELSIDEILAQIALTNPEQADMFRRILQENPALGEQLIQRFQANGGEFGGGLRSEFARQNVVTGKVESATAGAFTLSTATGLLDVTFDADTFYQTTVPASEASNDITIGVVVLVTGERNANGDLDARNITIGDVGVDGGFGVEIGRVNAVRGAIQSITSDSFIVRTDEGFATVQITEQSQAVIRRTLADALLNTGDEVTVFGETASDGSLVASGVISGTPDVSRFGGFNRTERSPRGE